MRTGTALVVGVLLFALALLIEAPATLVDKWLAAASGERARLADSRGTVWNGNGVLWLVPGFAGARIQWHLDAMPLLWGEARGSLRAQDGNSPRAVFALGNHGFVLRDVDLVLPADALLRAVAASLPLASAGGSVGLRADALALHGDAFEGRAALRWEGANLQGPTPGTRIALGDVRLDAVGDGRALIGTLANAGGDVDISGSTSFASDAMRAEVLVRPRAGIDAERSRSISSALALLGRPDAQNGYRFVWSARLR
jgi:general secretion pathway protein N